MKYITTAGIQTIENGIRHLARLEASDRQDKLRSRADHFKCERIGMINIANELGVSCGCAETPMSRTAEDCACAGSLRGMYAKLDRIPGRGRGPQRGNITLAGAEEGCRDKDGEFVPVAQCNPPWARRKTAK